MTTPQGFFPATAMPDADWWQALWSRPDQVLADLGIAPGTEMTIDPCCGDGLSTVPLARLVRHFAAIDIDPRMLALAREKVTAIRGGGNCESGNRCDRSRRSTRHAGKSAQKLRLLDQITVEGVGVARCEQRLEGQGAEVPTRKDLSSATPISAQGSPSVAGWATLLLARLRRRQAEVM
jgi:hypothetical protein